MMRWSQRLRNWRSDSHRLRYWSYGCDLITGFGQEMSVAVITQRLIKRLALADGKESVNDGHDKRPNDVRDEPANDAYESRDLATVGGFGYNAAYCA